MPIELFRIHTMRVDVPVKHLTLYMFVRQSHAKWDPWWLELWAFLLEFVSPGHDWKPSQQFEGDWLVRPPLNVEQQERIRAFLRTAPVSEVAGHKTLSRAVATPDDRVSRIALMFFAH